MISGWALKTWAIASKSSLVKTEPVGLQGDEKITALVLSVMAAFS